MVVGLFVPRAGNLPLIKVRSVFHLEVQQLLLVSIGLWMNTSMQLRELFSFTLHIYFHGCVGCFSSSNLRAREGL